MEIPEKEAKRTGFFKRNTWSILIWILIALIPLTPLILNLIFIHCDIDTGDDLGNKEWLAFWGSYLGGVATLIAVCITLSQNTKVIKQNEKIIIQNQDNLKFQYEQSRLALMPYIDVRILEDKYLHKDHLQPPNCFIILTNEKIKISSKIPEKYHKIIESLMITEGDANGVYTIRVANINFVRLVITQKAPSLAREIHLSFINKDGEEYFLTPMFVMASGESLKLPILFGEDYPEGSYKFILSFEDIEGHKYKQFFIIHHKGYGEFSIVPISSPELQLL